MKVLIIISIFCIIVLYYICQTEGFEDIIDPSLIEKYTKFVSFYNPFLVNWEKAIVTSIALDTPIQPLTDPSQVGSKVAPFKGPTRVEINTYIQKLEKTLNKPFPLVTDPLPSTLDANVINQMNQRISMDPSSYQNALQWMNNSLSEAHKQMNALKKSPEGFDVMDKYQVIEHFDNCAEYSKCMDVYNEQQIKKEKDRRKQLEDKLNKINSDSTIQREAKKNQELIKKSKEIEEQAKSGGLLNQFNLSNNDDSLSHFVRPSGVDKLANMKKNNPNQYKKNEKENGQFLALGTLLNSISNTIR
jgi:hypothetical protein